MFRKFRAVLEVIAGAGVMMIAGTIIMGATGGMCSAALVLGFGGFLVLGDGVLMFEGKGWDDEL
jgi:hypothetical protein